MYFLYSHGLCAQLSQPVDFLVPHTIKLLSDTLFPRQYTALAYTVLQLKVAKHRANRFGQIYILRMRRQYYFRASGENFDAALGFIDPFLHVRDILAIGGHLPAFLPHFHYACAETPISEFSDEILTANHIS